MVTTGILGAILLSATMSAVLGSPVFPYSTSQDHDEEEWYVRKHPHQLAKEQQNWEYNPRNDYPPSNGYTHLQQGEKQQKFMVEIQEDHPSPYWQQNLNQDEVLEEQIPPRLFDRERNAISQQTGCTPVGNTNTIAGIVSVQVCPIPGMSGCWNVVVVVGTIVDTRIAACRTGSGGKTLHSHVVLILVLKIPRMCFAQFYTHMQSWPDKCSNHWCWVPCFS